MTLTCNARGVKVTRQYKAFLATSRLVSGEIRVVILRFEDGGWAPYFCTDSAVAVGDILEAVAARWAIEEYFHDAKEVWGAGQQQVRNVWSNLGGWLSTLVELCRLNLEKDELTDRRRHNSREMLEKQFLAALPLSPRHGKLQTLVQRLIALAT